MINLRHILVVLLVSGGCAAPSAELRTDNHNLTDTVAELRAERREQDRKLEDMQKQLNVVRIKAMPAIAGEPSLPVVVASPPPPPPSVVGATSPSDLKAGQRLVGVDAEGDEIVYEGDAAAGKVATLDADDTNAANSLGAIPPARRAPRAEGAVEVTHRTPTAARAQRSHVRPDTHDVPGERTAPAGGGDPGSDYRAAVAQLKAGDYDGSITALRAFIAHYPHHDYADNAQYWLGEAYYVQKDYTRALVEFRATIETYPRGNKVPDALLKVGYCYAAMGQDAKARAVLEQVVNLYPKSEPSQLAAKRLETP